MSDNETQAKGKFEPPPWEREAFDALAAKRAEDKLALEALKAAEAARAAEAAKEEKPAPDPVAEALIASVKDETPKPEPEAAPAAKPVAEIPAEKQEAVDAMLLRLQAEERSDGSGTRIVGWVASAVTFVLGSAMLIYGLIAARDAGGKFANVVGSAVLSVFGLSFMGMAIWVFISTSRSRGR